METKFHYYLNGECLSFILLWSEIQLCTTFIMATAKYVIKFEQAQEEFNLREVETKDNGLFSAIYGDRKPDN